ESGAVAQPTTSEMSRIQAACQGIRRVPSGGIGECRTSKLNSRGSWEVSVENHPNVSILSELSGVATEIAAFVNHFHVIYQKLDASHKISGFL
ncbi:hypothetical protein ACET6Y_14000, partial [Aeromonas veronii]